MVLWPTFQWDTQIFQFYLWYALRIVLQLYTIVLSYYNNCNSDHQDKVYLLVKVLTAVGWVVVVFCGSTISCKQTLDALRIRLAGSGSFRLMLISILLTASVGDVQVKICGAVQLYCLYQQVTANQYSHPMDIRFCCIWQINVQGYWLCHHATNYQLSLFRFLSVIYLIIENNTV